MTLSRPLILASGSPRRRELLQQAGVTPQVFAVDIDETVLTNESPTEYIMRMVQTKMGEAQKRWQHTAERMVTEQSAKNHGLSLADGVLMLTADTIGVLPDQTSVLIKPKNKQHALDMWRQMSDDTHSVWTAVQIASIDEHGNQQASRTLLEKTEVTFVPLSFAQMQAYWQTGEPQDKAGGYAIQGLAAAWVRSINGSYTNVVGLPLAQTMQVLSQLDTSI